MKMQCPECPQSIDELEELLIGLKDPRYNIHPREYRQGYETLKNRLLESRISEENVRAFLLSKGFLYFPEEHEQVYSNIKKWGENQSIAKRHFKIHFRGEEDGPCEHCNKLYNELVSVFMRDLALDRGIDLATADKKTIMDLMIEANLEYIGEFILH